VAAQRSKVAKYYNAKVRPRTFKVECLAPKRVFLVPTQMGSKWEDRISLNEGLKKELYGIRALMAFHSQGHGIASIYDAISFSCFFISVRFISTSEFKDM